MTSNDICSIAQELDIIEKEYSMISNHIANMQAIKTVHGDFTALIELANLRKAKKFSNYIKTALLVSNNFQLGFARMYQTFNDNPQVTIQIFNNELEAIEWFKNR